MATAKAAAIKKVIMIGDKKRQILDVYSGIMGAAMIAKVIHTKWLMKDLEWLENVLRKKAIDERERKSKASQEVRERYCIYRPVPE
jgi:hypothetical protein